MEDIPFTRILDPLKSPRLAYRRTKGEAKLNIHIGQRKLLISEIEFLTNYGHLAKLVVYAGAAHGTHIAYLSKLFPDHQFDLWDPATFIVKETERIKIYNQLFLDQNAQDYAREKGGENILFISDVRSVQKLNGLGDDQDNNDEWENEIVENMNMQEKWIKIIQPQMSMVKFRLPYRSGKTTYLAGEIHFQAWAPQTSTETRYLISRSDVLAENTITFDHDCYNDQMFRFNWLTRSQWFPHNLKCGKKAKIPGLDHCYDCAAEIFILRQYLKSLDGDNSNNNNNNNNNNDDDDDSKQIEQIEQIEQMMFRINKFGHLNQAPHGCMPMVKNRDEKRRKLKNVSLAYQQKKIKHKVKLNNNWRKHKKKT